MIISNIQLASSKAFEAFLTQQEPLTTIPGAKYDLKYLLSTQEATLNASSTLYKLCHQAT
jgi:hypothetical protein